MYRYRAPLGEESVQLSAVPLSPRRHTPYLQLLEHRQTVGYELYPLITYILMVVSVDPPLLIDRSLRLMHSFTMALMLASPMLFQPI